MISLENVSKLYTMGSSVIYALKNISIKFSQGDFVVILGPSGSGKTTLLNLVGGIDGPSSGKIVVDGSDISKYDDALLNEYRRRKIGFVFQFFNLIPSLTVLENVQLAAELVDDPLDPVEVLELVGLGDKLRSFPSQLSGGEQQRVSIARALVKNTPIILCDEPTGELDFETGRKILSLLREINKKYKKTTLLVTHNTPISKIADRVVRLRSGEIVEDKTITNPIDPSKIIW